jgi:hypothetical protein
MSKSNTEVVWNGEIKLHFEENLNGRLCAINLIKVDPVHCTTVGLSFLSGLDLLLPHYLLLFYLPSYIGNSPPSSPEFSIGAKIAAHRFLSPSLSPPRPARAPGLPPLPYAPVMGQQQRQGSIPVRVNTPLLQPYPRQLLRPMQRLIEIATSC